MATRTSGGTPSLPLRLTCLLTLMPSPCSTLHLLPRSAKAAVSSNHCCILRWPAPLVALTQPSMQVCWLWNWIPTQGNGKPWTRETRPWALRGPSWCLPMGALLEYVEHMLQAGLWPAVYEVLLPCSVCKLYLDVEYNRELNPGRTLAGDDAVLAHMQLLLQHACGAAPSCHWHRLVAHSDKIFLAHLICTSVSCSLPATKQYVLDAQFHQLHLDMPFALVHSAAGGKSMIDASVYSKHQQFRLAFSTKYSQCRPLLPAAMTSVFTHPNSVPDAAIG
jgi:hypothetical protein